MLSKNHYINLASGRFDDTKVSDLDAAFQNLDSSKPESGLVVHFHGGLVNEQAAMTSAEGLFKAYTEAGAYPFFFVWESGLWESFRNNLRDIADEKLFKKIVGYLVEHLLGKLGIDSAVSVAESQATGKTPHEEVEAWIERQKMPTSPVSPKAPFDGIRNEEARKGLTGQEADEKELEAAMRGDQELEGEIQRLNRQLNQPPSPTEANDSGLGYNTPGHLSPNALQELTGAHQHPGQVPQVNESIIGIGITLGRVAVAAARIGYRVIRRFSQGRDHGLYTTVVEEVLRDLYIGQLGSALFWNQMKRDMLDSFGDNDKVYGGTAFLRKLVKRFDKSSNSLRVTLVGHSAGAIYLCNFLLNAHRAFKERPDVKFDVVMLAPAVDFELFNQAIQTQRIANLRSFGMSDQLEAKDALLAPFSNTLRYVYPKSLLYLVSGLLETEVDRPLVGMERYYLGQQYTGRLFTAVAAVKKFFASGADRLIWSPAKGKGPGLNTDSTRHMDFNQTDAATLASLQHVLKSGFAREESPDTGLESIPVERMTEPNLDVLVERLGDSEAIQALNQFSNWFDNNTPRKLQKMASPELYASMAKAMPIAHAADKLSDGELAKLTLKLAAQDEHCQKPLTEIVKSSKPSAEGSSTLMPNSLLVGLQSQVHIDEADGKYDVRVRQPSYELSRSMSEIVLRGDESQRVSPRSSDLVINENRVAAALAALDADDLAAIYAKVSGGDPPQITAESREQHAWQLVNDKLNRGESLEDLLIAANLVVPSAGLLQLFLAKGKKVSKSLRRRLSIAPEVGGFESVNAPSFRASPMTLRLRSSDVSLDKVPGLTVISQLGTIVAAEGTAESLAALEGREDILTIEGPSAGFTPECVNSMPRINATVAKSKSSEGGDQCLVAIIDGGIDVMHHAFRSAANLAQSRLVGVWDLTDPTGKQNAAAKLNAPGTLLPPPGFEAAGGTWHSQAAINGYLASGVLGGQLQRDPGGHGTHVASIASGTRPASAALQDVFPGGVAHDARILAIVIGDSEYEQGSPSQIGYSTTLITALRFAEAKAEEMALPLVVNLSQGQHSGGHDGTTALELAIDSFTTRAPGRAVVKSAGNNRADLGHAYITMSPNSQEVLEWNSNVQKPYPKGRLRDLIEVWFNPSEQMGFMLVTPDSVASKPVNFGNDTAQDTLPNGNSYKLEYVRNVRDNGLGRLRIEITKGSAAAIRDGKWQLEIVNSANSAQQLHAWVEITDWQPVAFINFPAVDTTLTIPGTANSVITVAAVETTDNVKVARFSAYGKTRSNLEKPEIAAPGVGIRAALSGTTFDFEGKSGTSMAAPHVTGAIALVFSAAKKQGLPIPSANDVRQAFRSFSINQHWDRGSGFGVLNVDALMQYFNLYPPPLPPQLAGAPGAGS